MSAPPPDSSPDFIGRNNVMDATVASLSEGSAVLRFANGNEVQIRAQQRATGVTIETGARVGVCIRAESVQLSSGPGLFSGTVTRCGIHRSRAILHCVHGRRETSKSKFRHRAAGPIPGEKLTLNVDAAALHLVPSV